MVSPTTLTVPPASDVDYPDSDGKPIGETDFHVTAILTLLQTLRDFFADAADVYVGADMMFYYEQGNPEAVRSPDVFVVKGVGKHKRRSYKLWEERTAAGRLAVPCTIVEVTSKKTRREDQNAKYSLYERLGVQEYVLFDPLAEYLAPPLQGFQLQGGRYRPLPLAADGSLASQALGLKFKAEGDLLRVLDPATGRVIPTSGEAAQQARREAERAAAAEARLAELQAELERIRGRQT